MPQRVPIHFADLGGRLAPVVQIHIKQLGKRPRIHEFALMDTGSVFTIVPRKLLETEGFDLSESKELESGIFSVGGRTDAWYLEDVVVALEDDERRLHHVNLKRLFFTDASVPPLVGRELLTLLSAELHIDFGERTGYLEVG